MAHVIDSIGERAEIDWVDELQARLRLDDGQSIIVPRSALMAQNDGSYLLHYSIRALLNDGLIVVPVVREEVDFQKYEVEGATVRVHKTIRQEEVVVDEPLRNDEVEVRHVPINRYLEAPIDVRQEGETTIIPVMEEVLVVEKRLILREEIHLVRKQRETHAPQTFTLRREEVSVDRVNPEV